ncbi:MAG: PDZ domain-containing protein, partial [Flavobacterium sp.]|nr:PDZ domain-containing protein [Flavobacterium sp.]
KINYYGVRNITDYVFRVSNAIADLDKVEFVKTKIDAPKTAPKYKVTLGIMPDYTDHGDGLHVDGVTDNRPAQLAGIQSGDIITKIGDCEIKEVYGYMKCLSGINAGDELPVTFLRNGETMTAKVKF